MRPLAGQAFKLARSNVFKRWDTRADNARVFKRFRDLELSPVLLCGASLLAFAAVLALVKGSSPSTAGAATGA